ncbi:phosphoribosylanthranilate isomerase [Pseudonocardia nematodicida]|uniref:N-(5'-phosphoribosyl)anthranilate isomerase n=1 Tax=Pseudonocardia nematodicida TaxID=1206997 RepID=A0ABV1KEZ1_9PSEU
MFVKVCGLRTPDDVRAAEEAGADAVGFVISPSSVRHVEPSHAAELVAAAGGAMTTVVVVADLAAGDAARITHEIGADVLQLHGARTVEDYAAADRWSVRLWRATSLRSEPEPTVGLFGEEALLLDSPRAGSGHAWDLTTLPPERRPAGRWLLAGGLDPDTVTDAIAQVAPWGVDVSSGVESTRGVKDHDRITAFVAAARAAG